MYISVLPSLIITYMWQLHSRKRCNCIFWTVCTIACFIHISASAALQEAKDNSTTVDLIFLTNVNLSFIHQNDYHVVELKLASSTISYTMHISKSWDLLDTEVVGLSDEDMKELDCMYTGPITSPSSATVGMASLSSCFHSQGFEGLVLLDNVHYHLAPLTSHPVGEILDPRYSFHSLRFRRSSGINSSPKQLKAVVKHKITAAKTSTDKELLRHDSKKVPADKRKEAWKQMLADQEVLEDEEDEENSDDNEDADISSVNLDTNMLENSDDSPELEGEQDVLAPQTVKVKQKIIIRKVARVVELAVFTDQSLYKKFKSKHANNAEAKLTQYVVSVVNNINYLYAQPSMKEKISFRLVQIRIQQKTPAGLKVTSKGDSYLDSFCNFAGKKDDKGIAWDHAMMLTGLDLKSTGDLLGIAMGSSMCLRYWSCSLVDTTKGFEAAFTAAHEIGHSLGMEHDGEAMNKRCDASKFLMGAGADYGQVNWSQCSNANIKSFLASGDPTPGVKDSTSIPRCLTKRGSKKKEIKLTNGQFPGQTYNAKKQCEIACGKCTPYVQTAAPFNNICWTLFCSKSSEIIGIHPALEGTSCGKGKNKCRNGKCQ